MKKLLDWFYGIIETYSGKLNGWAWDKRWKQRDHHEWVKGYKEWKELKDKGVVSDKVKLGDLRKLNKERCPHN